MFWMNGYIFKLPPFQKFEFLNYSILKSSKTIPVDVTHFLCPPLQCISWPWRSSTCDKCSGTEFALGPPLAFQRKIEILKFENFEKWIAKGTPPDHADSESVALFAVSFPVIAAAACYYVWFLYPLNNNRVIPYLKNGLTDFNETWHS